MHLVYICTMSTPHVTSPKTLQEAILYFADEDNCLAYFVAKRWPDGVICPTCGSKEVLFLKNQRRWKCRVQHERQQFSVKIGTVMEDSAIPLSKWLPAIWMITNAKNGISSCEIARALDVTQKTAWFLLHRIRYVMQQGSLEKMSGQIEADETYIGGLARNMHKSKKKKKITGTGGSGKAIVLGLLERHGIDKASKVRAKVIQNTDKERNNSKSTVHQGTPLRQGHPKVNGFVMRRWSMWNERPAPPGFRWRFAARIWHWLAKKYLYAADYGLMAFRFLVRA